MKRKRYDEETKAAFLEATKSARAEKKPWAEAFTAAQDAGYKGSLGGIKQLMMKLNPSAAPKRKPGRPRKNGMTSQVSGRRRGRPQKIAPIGVGGNGLQGIDQIIDGLVSDRVRKGIEVAIVALRNVAAGV